MMPRNVGIVVEEDRGIACEPEQRKHVVAAREKESHGKRSHALCVAAGGMHQPDSCSVRSSSGSRQ